MDVRTYTLFIYGTFEGHDEVEFFCMEVMSSSPAVKTLRYVIENNNNIIVIFDSDVTLQKLVNRTVERYVKDDEFRKEMNEYLQLQISGSQF